MEERRRQLPIWRQGFVKGKPTAYPNKEIQSLVSSNRVVILKAGTGIGKTTQIPEILLDTIKGKIVLTQPRVFNVIENATTIAHQFSEEVGQKTVSYSTGISKRIVPPELKTERIILQTEGTLLRRMLSNPEDALKGVGIIILDEIHERTIEAELILFLLKNKYLRELNSNLKVFIMSATFEPEVFKQYLSSFKPVIVEITGETFGYDIHWLPTLNLGKDYLEEAINVLTERIPHQQDGINDVLVFLPTKRDIESLEWRIKNKIDDVLITKNYRGIAPNELQLSTLPFKEAKERAEMPRARYRIILSTNISETGITFTNLKYVIDTGWYNGAYFDPFANAQILVKSPISQNTALQRWGRVGRISKGVVFPLYTKLAFDTMSKDNFSRIYTSNLDEFFLYLTKYLNGGDYNSPDLLTLPTPESANRSLSKLQLLNFINPQTGRLSYLGNLSVGMKGKPQHLKMLFNSFLFRVSTPICVIIAMLNVGLELLFNPMETYPLLSSFIVQGGGFSDQIGLWLIYNAYLDASANPNINLYRWCQSHGIDYDKMALVNEEIINLKEQLNDVAIPILDDPDLGENPSNPQLLQRIKKVIFRGNFINVAQQETPNSQFYVSHTDPSIKGKVIRSFFFSNINLKGFYPEFITFETLNITKSPDTGISSYNFELATGFSREEFIQFKKELI